MRHTVLHYTLAAAVLFAAATPAHAQCADQVILGCDTAFPPTSFFGTPFRGWCYLTGLATCAAG